MSSSPKQAFVPAGDHAAALFFMRLMELLPDHVYFKDREGRFVCINTAQCKFFGLNEPAQAIGKSDFDFFDAEFARQKDSDEREIIRTGIGFVGKEERSDAQDGSKRWVISTKLPLIGYDDEIIGTFGISRDVTDTKLAHEALETQHRLLQTLIEILPCRIFVKDREGRLSLTNQAYRRELGAESVDEVVGRRREEIIQDARSDQAATDDKMVLDSGRPIINREGSDTELNGEKRWSLLSKVPLKDREGRIVGIVGMAADISAQKEAEARAVRAQRELEFRSRQMESELSMAREMQLELMNASVQSVRESLDLSSPFAPQIVFVYEPSEHLAGDFFQAVPLSRNKIGLLVCDVMGHGVKAALVTTLMRGLLAELSSRDSKPSHVLAALNERLCSLLDRPAFPRFVTALYATIDTNEGRLLVANAGHPWPLLLRRGEGTFPISTVESGSALGLIPNSTYEAVELRLAPGDRLLLYTDGLKEEQNYDGEEFGAERIAASLNKTAAETPEQSLRFLLQEIRGFSGSSSTGDDLCAVVAHF